MALGAMADTQEILVNLAAGYWRRSVKIVGERVSLELDVLELPSFS